MVGWHPSTEFHQLGVVPDIHTNRYLNVPEQKDTRTLRNTHEMNLKHVQVTHHNGLCSISSALGGRSGIQWQE